jgi:Winged helix DNA-binding domain
VVRGSLLRGTQHMVTAADYLAWRPLLQPVLGRGVRTFARATAGIDPAELAATARRLLTERPLTRSELGRLLPDDLIRRHLAAFGPASVADIQAWSGLTRLREPVERLGTGPRRFRDGHGRILYDLPDAPRPDPDTPAPARFLPHFDNVLLAHADRTRIMTDEHRRRVSYGAVVEPTLLVDGQVVAIWKLVLDRGQARLEIEPLSPLSPADRAAATQEGERLLAFAADDADGHDIWILAPAR